MSNDNEKEIIPIRKKRTKKEEETKKVKIDNKKIDSKKTDKKKVSKKTPSKNKTNKYNKIVSKNGNVYYKKVNTNKNKKKTNKETPKKIEKTLPREELEKVLPKEVLEPKKEELEKVSKPKAKIKEVKIEEESVPELETAEIELQEIRRQLENIEKNKKEQVSEKKSSKKIVLIISLIIFIILIILGSIYYDSYNKELKEKKVIRDRTKLVETINSHYNNYIKVNKDAKIYKFLDNEYKEYGTVYKDNTFTLEKRDITYLTEYFYIIELDSYIKYQDVDKIDNLNYKDNRYKNYIPFNKNIITNNPFTLYKDDKMVYTFNEKKEFPIIIDNDDNKYYVEYNDELLYILKDDIEKIIDSNNTKLVNAKKITTLCYHRVYDTDEKCTDQSICKSKNNFDREMKYLSDNKFFTLNMNEMILYLSKKLQIPRNSILITLDDGYLVESAIEVLEKYQTKATLFIKTGEFNNLSNFKSNYLELHSHTDKLHVANKCPRVGSGQGGAILCYGEDTILNDLKTSREKLNNSEALAFPFYDYNDRAIRLVKQAGFKISFIGADNKTGRSYPGINMYKVPRMTIWNTTSFDKFKSYVNN